MKIAILADTHCGVRNSSDIYLDYHGRFFSEVFFPYCQQNGVKQVLHLGDYYDHRKYVNFKALNHNRKTFLEPMRDMGMTMDIIPGNHDVVYKNTNSLCSLRELMGYYMKEVNIVMRPKVMNYDGCRIALLPWINPENYESSMRFLETCDASILGAHLELAGFDVAKGQPAQTGMDPNIFSRFEIVMSGHYHTRSQKKNIHYLGCPFEMFWGDAHDPKYFYIFDTATRQITPVLNPLTIYRKIVYDDRATDFDTYDISNLNGCFVKIVVTNKTDQEKFDRFVDRIQKMDVFEIKIAESYDEFSGDRVSDDELDGENVTDTSSLLDSYVNVVETDLDKTVIKARLHELYVEAQSAEIA